jgi:hypothetical protein
MTIVLYVDDKQSKRQKFMSSGHDDLLLLLLLLLLLSHQNIYVDENWSNDFWLILPY